MTSSSPQVVIVGGPDFLDCSATGFATQDNNPLLMVDGSTMKYEASIPFLCEYFKNGKNADLAAKSLEESKGDSYISLALVFLKQMLEKERGLTCETVYTFNDSIKPDFERWVKGAKLLLISTSFMIQWKFVEAIAAHAKKVNPNITVIAGGMAVFKYYEVFFNLNVPRNARAKQMLEKGELAKDAIAPMSYQNHLFLQPIPSAIDFAICSLAGEHTLLKLVDSLAAVSTVSQSVVET